MALNYFIGAFNILTDFLVFVIPTAIVLKVQTSNSKKLIVIAAFAARPMYVSNLITEVLPFLSYDSASAANIAQLYTLGSDADSSDRTRKSH